MSSQINQITKRRKHLCFDSIWNLGNQHVNVQCIEKGRKDQRLWILRNRKSNKGDLQTLEDDERGFLCLLSTSRDKFCLLVSFAHSDIYKCTLIVYPEWFNVLLVISICIFICYISIALFTALNCVAWTWNFDAKLISRMMFFFSLFAASLFLSPLLTNGRNLGKVFFHGISEVLLTRIYVTASPLNQNC